MADRLRIEGEIIESTAGQIAAELERRGIDPARPVIVAVEPDDWIAEARRYARPRVVAAGLSDADIDRLIKQVQREVEPDFGRRSYPEQTRPRRASLYPRGNRVPL